MKLNKMMDSTNIFLGSICLLCFELTYTLHIMIIKEEELAHWVSHFYGYGSWKARIWFIAYEEGGGDTPEEVADKFNYFYRVHPSGPTTELCDIRLLYKNVSFTIDGPRADLFATLFDYRFGHHAVQHGSWKNLIAFVHGFKNHPLPDLINYQRDTLAIPSYKNEALLRLFPLPAHNHAWYYSWLNLPRLNYLLSRNAYEEFVYPDRINHLLSQMKEYKPEVVVMYGMNNINKLKQSVQSFYPGTSFKMIKAVKREIPQHHMAEIPGTILLITTQIPQLRHNRIETGFDWEKWGKSLRPEGI